MSSISRNQRVPQDEMASRRRGYPSAGRFNMPMDRKRLERFLNIIDYWRGKVDEEPEEEDPVIKVQKCNLKRAANSLNHHTKDYDKRYYAIRRGQPFEFDIELSRPYDAKKDTVSLVFEFGDDPLVSKGTEIKLYLSQEEENSGWTVKITSKVDNKVSLQVTTPPDCYVGKWKMTIWSIKAVDGKVKTYRYIHKPSNVVYILFNAWCKDDAVYLEDEDKRGEYVLNDKGAVFVGGDHRFPSRRAWAFAQFEEITLDCALYLLDTLSNMKRTARGNPIFVTRQISALVNAQDDNGILVGNWSGNYSDGTSPTAWTGSQQILEEFYRDKEPVCFGQCWVFSCVTTTICRALGIPCRTVTNFSSAHDTDGSSTIDSFFDEDGNKLDSPDSIWNFHVWNDVWMTRPDLPPGYGGWQAIDATPQETSEGVYCMGPMSLKAIKEGNTHLPYDGLFVYAEVNGDRITWQLNEQLGTFKHLYTDRDLVGTGILTRKISKNEKYHFSENITDEYKYEEGKDHNKEAAKRARRFAKTVYEEKPKDIKCKLLVPYTKVTVGKSFDVSVALENTSDLELKVKEKVHVESKYYTGIKYSAVKDLEQHTTLKPGQEEVWSVTVEPDDYMDKLTDYCILNVTVYITCPQPEQTYCLENNVMLHKPELDVKATGEFFIGKEIKIDASFDNPLEVPLTKCELRVEGPGLQKPLLIKDPKKVDAKGKYKTSFKIVPSKPGDRELFLVFNCKQLYDICGTNEMKIEGVLEEDSDED